VGVPDCDGEASDVSRGWDLDLWQSTAGSALSVGTITNPNENRIWCLRRRPPGAPAVGWGVGAMTIAAKVALVPDPTLALLGLLRHGTSERARRRIASSLELDDLVAGVYVVQKELDATITGCHSGELGHSAPRGRTL
jgi:hypothetical protein